jgi:hypothetical protein
MNELEINVIDYLLTHRILTMATASSDGIPDATALEYASDEFIVYVSVRKNSRKVSNIEENPIVFYEIHEDMEITMENVQNLKAIQCSASPQILDKDDEGFHEAFDLMEKKYPVFNRVPREKRVILKFTPRKIWYLNYKDKMFHRDEISFE